MHGHRQALDRRLLILLDEVSKALPPEEATRGVSVGSKEVMRQIGELLDEDGTIDVIASSLSPTYVSDLLTGSQRPVNYVIMSPLLGSDLGRKETAKWCSNVLDLPNRLKNNTIDDFSAKLLYSTYKWCSGYPRGVERLVKSYCTNTVWQKLDTKLSEMARKKGSVSEIVPCLTKIVSGVAQIGALGSSNDIALKYVLSAKDIALNKMKADLRGMVEDGAVYMVNSEGGVFFKVSMQLSDFIDILQDSELSSSPVVDMVVELFSPLFRNGSIEWFSTWFKHAVALTILVRSAEGSKPFLAEDLSTHSLLSLRMCQDDQKMKKALTEDSVLIVPPAQTICFDLLVCMNGLYYYLQCKSPKSSTETPVEKVANCILNTIRFHVDNTPSFISEDLGKLVVVFYQWGSDLIVTKDDIECQLAVIRNNIRKSETKRLRAAELAEAFVKNHFASNFYPMAGASLANWLLPVLVPIPHLVNEVYTSVPYACT